jgi:bifunctional N-acetylglucosamine-1-phosphate-uridyltransferase/glucosamine-1-phosphate-acetyltransferase GlmU-like protein
MATRFVMQSYSLSNSRRSPITLGEGDRVGAGSTLTKDVPAAALGRVRPGIKEG